MKKKTIKDTLAPKIIIAKIYSIWRPFRKSKIKYIYVSIQKEKILYFFIISISYNHLAATSTKYVVELRESKEIRVRATQSHLLIERVKVTNTMYLNDRIQLLLSIFHAFVTRVTNKYNIINAIQYKKNRIVYSLFMFIFSWYKI